MAELVTFAVNGMVTSKFEVKINVADIAAAAVMDSVALPVTAAASHVVASLSQV